MHANKEMNDLAGTRHLTGREQYKGGDSSIATTIAIDGEHFMLANESFFANILTIVRSHMHLPCCNGISSRVYIIISKICSCHYTMNDKTTK